VQNSACEESNCIQPTYDPSIPLKDGQTTRLCGIRCSFISRHNKNIPSIPTNGRAKFSSHTRRTTLPIRANRRPAYNTSPFSLMECGSYASAFLKNPSLHALCVAFFRRDSSSPFPTTLQYSTHVHLQPLPKAKIVFAPPTYSHESRLMKKVTR